MKKDLVLSSVQNSVSSIFTKENVITLINLIDEGSSRKITTDDINRAIDKVVDYMDRDQREIFDFDNAEFELNYDNRIECVGVPVNTDAVREILENNFMDFGEAETEVETEVETEEKVDEVETEEKVDNEL